MGYATLIDDIYIDTVTRRSHSAPISVTTNTIEDGTQMAQHAVRQVETLELDISLTDDKHAYFGDKDALVKASYRVTSKEDKKKALHAIKDDLRLINVTMLDDHFPDFAIVDIQANEQTIGFSVYNATVILQKIRTAETITKKVPLETIRKKNDEKKTRAAMQQSETEDGGQVTPEEAGDSIASKMADYLLGLVQ